MCCRYIQAYHPDVASNNIKILCGHPVRTNLELTRTVRIRVLELRSILTATKGSWVSRAWNYLTGQTNKARVSELRILQPYVAGLPPPNAFRETVDDLAAAFNDASHRLNHNLRTPLDRLDLVNLHARPRPLVDRDGAPIAVDADTLLEHEIARVLGGRHAHWSPSWTTVPRFSN